MINKANELPITQVNNSLRHVECHVDDGNFFVLRIERLVGHKWVIDHPGLRHRLLRIVKLGQLFSLLVFITRGYDGSSDKIETELIRA